MPRRSGVWCTVTSVVLVGLAGCRPTGPPVAAQQPLRVGVAQELTPPSPFEPGGLGATIAELVFRPLLRETRDGTIEGELADRWTWSEDGRVIDLHLRANQRFSDGAIVTATDVVDTFRRSKELEIWGFDEVVDVESPQPAEIRVRPSRPFLLPGALLVGVARAQTSPPVGAGPYVVASPQGDASLLTLAANPHFGGPPPGVPAIEFHPFPNASDQWSNLLAQRLDVITFVPWNKFALLKQIPSIRPVVSLSRVFAELRLRDLPPPFDRPEARRALSLAIDRQELVETAFRGQATAAVGPVWPQAAEFDRDIPAPVHAPDEARRLLKQVGCIEDAEGRLRFGAEPVRLDVKYWPGFAGIETLALLIERQLAEAGIESHFVGLEGAEFRRIILGKGSGALLLERHAAGDLLSDEEYRTLPAASAPPVLASPEAVTVALRDAQRRLQDEVPAVYLVWTNRLDVIDRHFCGMPALPDGPEAHLDQVHPCADGEDR